MPGPRFAFPEGNAIALDLPARLESWNAREHPDQIALRAWVSHVQERISRAESEMRGELALRLDVGLPAGVDPMWQRDLDNYLYPVARALPGRYVSIWATKSPGRSSCVRIAPARALASDAPGWLSFDVPLGLRSDDAWKRTVADAVRRADELPTGPVALELGFVVGDSARWAQLWKPSIDGLEAVLGRSQAEPAWNPQDGRIVRLGMHRAVRPELGRDVTATVWVREAPLEWEENGWLRALPELERAAFFERHRSRVTRSQGRATADTPPREARARSQLVSVPGVVIFADDDAAYEAWLAATPAGYVLNALRSPRAGTVLHRAICRSVSGRPASGTTWTAGQYLKICATDPAALARCLEANGGAPARACRLCLAEGRP